MSRVVETRDASSPASSPESLDPHFQYVWSARYVDAAVLRDENTDADGTCDDGRIYYLSDANHNVTALVDASGAVQERYVYDPYGKVTIYDDDWSDTRSTSAEDNTRLYTGRELDEATGLYYYRARWYDTGTGQFTTRDPLGFAAGDTNLYRYVGNRPAGATDPSGLWEEWWWGSGGGGAEWEPAEPRAWYETLWGGIRREVYTTGLVYRYPMASVGAYGGSLGNSLASVPVGAYGIGQDVLGYDEEAMQTYDLAYELGPLGQTRDDDGVFYYGTRGALGLSCVAALAAGGTIVYEVTLAAGTGGITFGRLYGQAHVVFRGAGPVFHALGYRGAMTMSRVEAWLIPTATYLNTLIVPLRNPGAVTTYAQTAAANGTRFYNCLTAALKAIASGV